MRLAILLPACILSVRCAPHVDHRSPAGRVPPTVPAKPAIAPPPAAPVAPPRAPRATSLAVDDITFEGVAFDVRDHRLVVADQERGPGSLFADAESAGRGHGGLAAVNAGFFTPEGEPLGLVIAAGKRSGTWNTASSLGSGAWHADHAGNTAISRREKLGKPAAATMQELLQAGPMLVENSRPIGGLEAGKSRVRTLIAWDGNTRWWIGRSSPCTLAALARALASAGPAGWPVRHALNLDGGRSADLWISDAVQGGPLTRRSPWNRPVRNFLILKRR